MAVSVEPDLQNPQVQSFDCAPLRDNILALEVKLHSGADALQVTQSEIIRFLVKTDGYISCPSNAGREAKVYGGNPSIESAAYSIPEVTLKAMINEQLVGIASTRIDSRLTEKGKRLGARLEGKAAVS